MHRTLHSPMKEREAGRAADAVDVFAEAGRHVTQLPAKVKLHCRVCQHQGTATVPYGRKPWPRFRCSKCRNLI